MKNLGFPGILTIIFVIAKLTGHFPYPWEYCFLPIVIPVAMLLLILIGCGAALGLAHTLDWYEARKRAARNRK